MENVVELENASRRFGNVTALESVTLNLRAGEILGLYGPSGSGKTTTIRLILGVLQPTSGSVRILGVPSSRLGSRLRQQIGYAPQQSVYPPTLSAEEAIGFAAALFGLGWLMGPRAVRHVLEKSGLWKLRHRSLAAMSGGEKRLVTNAAALVHQPQIVFMDEPTSGLDPILRIQTWDWFRELKESGKTLLISGHYLAEAEFCDRMALLVHGKLAALGTPQELRAEALGGEQLDVEVAGSVAAALDALAGHPLIRQTTATSAGHLLVTVPDAAKAMPVIVDHLRDRGIQVVATRDVQPPFDEIFARLVRDNA
jgi:ABC-2 type transport system ATP-binding protein